jgi:hypothetical protein
LTRKAQISYDADHMKSVYFTLLMFFSVTVGISRSFAECSMDEMKKDPRSTLPVFELIDITADYYPNEVYHLGYTTNADRSINSIYYENGDHCRRYFSFHDLAGEIPIIQTTKGDTTYDLVRVHAEPSDAKDEYEVSMSYMTNGLFRNRDHIYFNLAYSSKKSSYQIVDVNTGKQLTVANATTNYWGSKAVGIKNIKCK